MPLRSPVCDAVAAARDNLIGLARRDLKLLPPDVAEAVYALNRAEHARWTAEAEAAKGPTPRPR